MKKRRFFIILGYGLILLMPMIGLNGCRIKGAKGNMIAIVYGKVLPEEVKNFRIVVVEPDHYTKEEIDAFHQKGLKVIAYLSLGEVDTNRWYYPYLREENLLLGKNEIWGSWYIRIESSYFQQLLLNKIVPNIMFKGFDGLFFDTVDAVAPYTERSHLAPEMANIICSIHQQYPDAIKIMNSGLFLLPQVYSSISLLAIEDVATSYDFGSGHYRLASDSSFYEKLSLLKQIREKYRLPVLIIDYADSDDLKREVEKRLSGFNAFYYISTVDLQKIPEYHQ